MMIGWKIKGGLVLHCAMCAGELYPGEPYFELEGSTVCEDCLASYAKGYFAHRLRRVGRPAKTEWGGGIERV